MKKIKPDESHKWVHKAPITFGVALYKGTRPGIQGLYSRAVRWVDRGPYSHCEMIFSNGISASASFIDKGVRFKFIEYSVGDNWDFIQLDQKFEADAKGWFYNRVNKSYDIMGNLRFVTNLVSDSRDKWFCSESVLASLGVKDAYRYGPSGMLTLLEVFSGNKLIIG